MSSLLSNDFVEEYRRFENVLTTNEEAVYIDREGKIIYTTPFKKESTITDVKDLVLDNNNSPTNVNLIIDQVSLISTNPNIQNYLPLKISFGNPINDDGTGGKPQVTFGDTDAYKLTDYKIIVDPKVNLDTIQNRRYTTPINCAYESEYDIVVISNIVQRDNDVYILYFDGDSSISRKVIKIEYASKSDYTTNTGVQNQTYGVNYIPLDIFANELIGFVLCSNGTEEALFDIQTSSIIPDSTLGAGESYKAFALYNTTIVAIDDSPLGVISYFCRMNNTYQRFYKEVSLGFSVSVASFYTSTRFVSFAIGKMEFQDISAPPNVSNRIFLNENISPVIGEPEAIYFGGSDLSKPIFNLFTIERNITPVPVKSKLRWYRFLDYGKLSQNLPVTPLLQAEFFVNDDQAPEFDQVFVKTKRYRNQAYFIESTGGQFSNRTTFCNLDNGSIIGYRSTDIVRYSPIQAVNIRNNSYIEGGRALLDDRDTLYWSIFKNNRPINQVYKVTYNYDERVLPYYKPTKFFFHLALPNNTKIADCEIFKYIIDYRIRYTKESISKPKPVPITEGTEMTQIAPNDVEMCLEDCMGCQGVECEQYKEEGKTGGCGSGGCPTDPKTLLPTKPDISLQDRGTKSTKEGGCYRHCSRRFGSAARVLGLNLPEDFNIEDFLNIYSTR